MVDRLNNSIKTYKKIKDILDPIEYKSGVRVLILSATSGVFEVIGMASIMPFIAIVTNSNLIKSNEYLSLVFNRFDFSSEREFLIVFGLLVFVILLLAQSVKALTAYKQLKFAGMIEYNLSRRLTLHYLQHPYNWFLNKNSADIGKTILSEVGLLAQNAIVPTLNISVQVTAAIFLTILLFIADPYIALTVALVLTIVYLLIFKQTSKILVNAGQKRMIANKARFKAVGETFGAIKEIKISNLEQIYIKRFSNPALSFVEQQIKASMIHNFPRYALETMAFGGIILIVLYLMINTNEGISIIPYIALYALAGYRLMPALQQIYSGFTMIFYTLPTIEHIHGELARWNHADTSNNHSNLESTFIFNSNIQLKDVSYSYPNSDVYTLKNLNMNIRARNTVGIVGSTGSGKTTVIDLLLGLHDPNLGELLVDKTSINQSNKIFWQKKIGYVPQQIYLADDTIAANIAFGVENQEVDHSAVERAAKMANLHDFISHELQDGYATMVGERGVMLSGGQRQRIGIARALYRNPEVLIFDEATSALDTITEASVMEAVNALRNDITIILVAHRLSTIKKCDLIFVMSKGRVVDEGTYDELYDKCKIFREMTIN